jgi:predicted GIY-YIG superfamily endonuclease
MNPAPSKYSVYHVYLLKNRKNNSLYIGYTNEKIEQKEGAG